eukprot:CAMPEP_0117040102 /NCGR_PEP_ID=MMETSP0472-20121206/28091_1 /TAXON_ID=693140 ORGANISM="Tiarina fusus, Strain LIS" /NCGR_SAMPLE_ID=MMETSP0472 /ASSEMBLY_ACC=CAM_ASM_000603 /LENGTH=630 /DNA_ID=CAMNT_0004750753 /DNA_START=278 /DNA_END=2171 /DNA_ORIENTATION=+
MPAVSVLPVMSATVTTAYPAPDTHILDSMPSPQGGPEVDSAPSPRTENEDSTTDGTQSSSGQGATPEKGKGAAEIEKSGDPNRKDGGAGAGNVSPSQSHNSYPQALPAHLTPQQPGYYVYQSQVTPEPPSPAGPGGQQVYDVGSFFQQPAAFQNSPFTGAGGHPYAVNPSQQQQQPPHSPSQNTSGSMGGIPPASPLFPRVTGQATAGLLDQHRFDVSLQQRGAPLSPGPPYLASPQLGPAGANPMYANMGPYGATAGPTGNSNSNSSPDEFGGWGDNRNPQNGFGQNSPQISAQGIPIPYVPGMPPPRSANAAGRSYSFEEAMLPPSAESQQQQDQNYSPYGPGQTNAAGGAPATLFAHQQQWGYPGGQPDMYGGNGSPLQPRPTMAYPGLPGGPPRHPPPPHMGPYGGQFYPATSPGPPIQTTTSNKGPDGANLFIFHIPNHFTNLDMYQLFCPYGNLLSVRIMVEKDTGRSRGFGFVSYDSPDAAALAIKELNGFPIGNKRLKVQHKQIRPSDQQHERGHGNNNNAGYDNMGGPHGGGYGRHAMPASLPPSGPTAMNNNSWYYTRGGPPGPGEPNPGSPHDAQLQEDPNNNQTNGQSGEGNPEGEGLSNLDPLRQNLPEVGGGSETH